MIVVLANNQVIIAAPGTTAVITTDPVPLNGNDRLTASVNVTTIFNVIAPGLRWTLEGSNDGVAFQPIGALGDTVAPGLFPWINANQAWAFVRARFELTANVGVIGCAIFDCHMNIDKE